MNAEAVDTRDDWLPSARALGELRTSVRQYRLDQPSRGWSSRRMRPWTGRAPWRARPLRHDEPAAREVRPRRVTRRLTTHGTVRSLGNALYRRSREKQ